MSDRDRQGTNAGGVRGGSGPAWGRGFRRRGASASAVAFLLLLPGGLGAQEHHEAGHSHGGSGHGAGLHFTHPLIAESISPDTKIRLDHQLFAFVDGDRENSGVLEGEYAFSGSFSIEAGIPYSYTATEFGNLEVLFKFANHAFKTAGVLLGYGVELGLPTNGTPEDAGAEEQLLGASRRSARGPPRSAATLGRSRTGRPGVPAPQFSGGGDGVEATLGTEEWEIAPFLNAGIKRGRIELVAWVIFGIPFNQGEPEELGTELEYSLSALYHLSSRVQALVEFDGSGGISGEPVGEDVVNLSPGLRVQVLGDRPLVLGSSLGFPLSDQRGFDLRWTTSLFWHF